MFKGRVPNYIWSSCTQFFLISVQEIIYCVLKEQTGKKVTNEIKILQKMRRENGYKTFVISVEVINSSLLNFESGESRESKKETIKM